MKVIGYIRVSTDEQASNGQSLDSQRVKLEAYASLYDLELVEIIEDAGQSGKTLKREGLPHALAMLRSGKAEGLLIAKLDRLTRSVGDWQILIDGYFGEKAGKQAIKEGKIFADPIQYPDRMAEIQSPNMSGPTSLLKWGAVG